MCVCVYALVLLGCAGNLVEMRYTSAIQGSYQLNTNAPIVLAPLNSGDLLASSYLPLVKQALERRGFSALYLQGQIPESSARNVVYISLVKLMRSYPSSSVQYIPSRMLDRRACFNYDGMYYCREESYPIITGYSTSLNLLVEYHFIMDWYDLYMKRRILYVDSSIPDSSCIYDGIYKDVISQTIARIDFSRGENYSFNAPLSYYTFGCLFQRSKSLGVKR